MGNQFELCCVCGEFSDLTCPACKKLYCVHCFSFHGEDCYEQSKQAEQKKCSICGRYASIAPTVHCSDCQIEICRSCLWAHKKTHEAEKKKCSECHVGWVGSDLQKCSHCQEILCFRCRKKHTEQKKCSGCNGDPAGPFVSCPDCGRELCEACMEMHRTRHGTWQERSKPKYRCATCGNPTTTECDECKKPYCESCFKFHEAVHAKKGKCAVCSNPAQEACPVCGVYYCVLHQSVHVAQAHSPYNTRFEYGNFDTKVHIDEDLLKNLRDAFNWAKSNEAQQQARAETERLRKEEAERMREQARQNDTFWQNMFNGRSSFYGEDEPEETDAYKAHYTGQQQSGHSQYSRQQQTASAPSGELVAAFKLLQLSQRATVQEVKRAFKRKAKEAHPDVGGTKEAFVKLNNAYELALAHAERNER